MSEISLSGAKVIISGGLGLIGSALARRLLDFGCDILLIDSLNENFGGNLFNIEGIRDRVRVNISDIRDIHGLRYLLRDCETPIQPRRTDEPHEFDERAF